MNRFFLLLPILPLLWQCNIDSKTRKNKTIKEWKKDNNTPINTIQTPKYDSIVMTNIGFKGYYQGPEYNEQGDLAHQFSNKAARLIGDFLKKAYNKQNYLKVNFKKTKIYTKNLDQKDSVYYEIDMPFERVTKCKAFTGIEHCGSWDQQPKEEITERLLKLKKGLREHCSIGAMEYQYFVSNEGFQEYWVQFMHRDYQVPCKD